MNHIALALASDDYGIPEYEFHTARNIIIPTHHRRYRQYGLYLPRVLLSDSKNGEVRKEPPLVASGLPVVNASQGSYAIISKS